VGATRQERMALGVLALLLAAGVGARALRTPADAAAWKSPDAAAEAPGAGNALLSRAEGLRRGDEAAAVPLGAGEKVDVNTASAQDLRRLPRVSRALAERIVARRTQRGPFRTLADLDSVSGVGAATLERLAPYLSLAAAPVATAPVTRSLGGASDPRRPDPAPAAAPAASGDAVVDVNTAGAAELEGLPGIGPALAARVVETRARKGRFASVDELAEVPGIGPAKLARLRPLVRVTP
jgi:competence ComEA-like helix-hairpin-helix protein